MTTANKQLIEKADMALADLASGGLMLPEQNDTFFRVLMVSPTLLNSVRFITMNSKTQEVNKMGFGSRIMRKGNEATALDASDRSKAQLSKVELAAKKVMAELYLPYEVILNNIERGNPHVPMGSSSGGIMDTIVAMIAQRAALDFEELALLGDTTSGDPYLALFDGWLKLCADHVVDMSGMPISKEMFKSVKKAMPDAYLRNPAALRHFVSMDQDTEYRSIMGDRATALGDSMVQGTAQIFAFGSPVVAVSQMPNTRSLFTDPTNLLFGIFDQLTLEYDKDISAQVFKIVLSAHISVQVETSDASVTTTDIG